jgi:hypothetical protein
MYLAYLDDSGTRQKDRAFQVMSAVIIDDAAFSSVEILMRLTIERWIPEDKIEDFIAKFTEFHVWELFGGYGPFEGIDQEARSKIIEFILQLIPEHTLKVVYGAVDKQKLHKQVYASANPVDICLRICANGIESWMAKNANTTLALLIADDCSKDKAVMKQSFRQLRNPIRPPKFSPGQLWHVHDEMYFGDSKDSIGLQLADSHSYFISKRLEKDDPQTSGFYDLIKDHIAYSSIEP